MEFLIYLLKSSVLVGLFLGVYEIFLKRDTFYQIKRGYLLVGVLLAAILPVLHITLINNRPEGILHETLQSIPLQNITVNGNFEATASNGISWAAILLGGYILGGLFFVIRYLIAFQKLNKLFQTTASESYQKGIWFCVSTQPIEPFSFFNRIVINPNQHSSEELDHIIKHEEAHIHFKHSLDVVFIKLICCLNWFNPLIWIYQKRLIQNLEMQADFKAIQQVQSAKAYQYTLVKNSIPTERFLPVNYFNQPFLKTRIMMLNKAKSNPRSVLKIGIILPLLVAFFMGFQVNLQAQEIQKAPVQEEVETVPFSAIQQAPIYPGCEDAANAKEQKECMTAKIQELVNQNFDVAAFKKDTTLIGTQRINAQFTVNEEGEVVDILTRSEVPELAAEAERALKLLPKMTEPGKQRDKPVRVIYTLPIVFQVGQTEQAK